MYLRQIGALLIIFGCSAMGVRTARLGRREICVHRDFLDALSFLENTLRFRLTPLPELCRQTARHTRGPVGEVFSNLARELDWQTAPDVYSCMCEAMEKSGPMPASIRTFFRSLGTGLGQFDTEGQLRQLQHIGNCCRQSLENLSRDKDDRLRSYRTLGVCTGIAIAVLLV